MLWPVPDAAGLYVTRAGAHGEAGDRICRADRSTSANCCPRSGPSPSLPHTTAFALLEAASEPQKRFFGEIAWAQQCCGPPGRPGQRNKLGRPQEGCQLRQGSAPCASSVQALPSAGCSSGPALALTAQAAAHTSRELQVNCGVFTPLALLEGMRASSGITETRDTLPRDFSEAFISRLTVGLQQATAGGAAGRCRSVTPPRSQQSRYGRCLPTSRHLHHTDLHHWDIHPEGTPRVRIKNGNNKAIYNIRLGIMQKTDDFSLHGRSEVLGGSMDEC